MVDYEADSAFLGDWGAFQRQVFFSLCAMVVSNAMVAVSIVFIGDTPPHRCVVPAHANITAAWRNVSVPMEVDGVSGASVASRCFRYNLRDLQDFSERGLVPGMDVNLSAVRREGCLDGWEYDSSTYTSTIATEWDLVCDDAWKVPMTTSIYFFGFILGSFLNGQLSDRYGRKVTCFAAAGIQVVFSLIQVFSPSWAMFCALQFIIGVGNISKYISAYVLGTEILSPSMRSTFCTLGVNLFFAAGYMLTPIVAYFFRDWRMLLLSLNAPLLLLAALWWCVPESPRWLVSQGRVEDAEAILRRAAQKNKMEAPPMIFDTARSERTSEKKEAHDICDLFRHGHICWMSFILWLLWISSTISYLALSLNTSNLHGNGYLNCFLSGLVEVPAYLLSSPIFRWWPRRLTMSVFLWLGGLVLLFTMLVPADLNSLAIALEMTGKCAVTMAFTTLYAYTVELYPTVLRNTALGISSMVARVGSITAPYFIFLRGYWVSLPYIVMGSIMLAAGLLSLLLPETKGKPLPDSIAQMHPFPGCFRKSRYKPTDTNEGQNKLSVI